jgi:hypothetical protein
MLKPFSACSMIIHRLWHTVTGKIALSSVSMQWRKNSLQKTREICIISCSVPSDYHCVTGLKYVYFGQLPINGTCN